jgi:hypothetical protein
LRIIIRLILRLTKYSIDITPLEVFCFVKEVLLNFLFVLPLKMAKPFFAFYFFGILSFGLSNPKLLATSAAQKALSVDDLGQKQKHEYLSYTQVRKLVL